MKSAPTEWDIEGMTCHTCSLNVKKVLEEGGMQQVEVSFANKTARFTIPEAQTAEPLKGKLKAIGYTVVTAESTPTADHSLMQLLIAAAFTFPLLLHMVSSWWLLHHALFQVILCLPVMYIGWKTFGKSAFLSVKNGSANMDVLVIMGSNAAFFYSLYGALILGKHDYLFFETAATIITFILLGEYIEHRSLSQTNSAVKALLHLQVPEAKLFVVDPLTSAESYQLIPSAQIMPGDRLQVNTGDSFAVDGIIRSGVVTVDEAMLTGESTPVEKSAGDRVIGGTLVVNGSAIYKATATGNQTVLASIIEMVKKAQNDLPPVQKLADKIAAWFVPVVLLLSGATFVFSYFAFQLNFEQSLMHAIAVLVISCPCAMGLATPLAVMVGVGKAANTGVLFKGNSFMQNFAQSAVWCFDKTGTLTTHEINLEQLNWSGEVKQIVKSVEIHSSHPIAQQLCALLTSVQIIPMRQITETKGLGMIGVDRAGNTYKVGKAALAGLSGTEQIYVFKNDVQLAAFTLADQLKPQAYELVQFCKRNQIEPILISGDRKDKCNRIAQQLGIDRVYAAQSPEGKIKIIQTIKQTKIVAMIGDGINDAPALAAANVGISLSNATAAAIETAHVVLLKDDLNLLIAAHRIAKATLRTIYVNLFWAFAYNIVAIPLAAFGFLSPMLSALSMAFSDVILVANSLLLKLKKLN